MKEKLLRAVVKYLNIKGLAKELVTEVADDLLTKVVEDSSTEFDDMAKAALWPVLEREAVKLIDEKLDMEAILGLKEAAQPSEEA